MLPVIGRTARALLCAATVCAATAATTEAAAASASRGFRFEVKWSMFPELTIATGQFQLSEEPGRYLMGLEARANLTTPRIDWRGSLAAEGERSRDGRKPLRFEQSSVRPSQKTLVVVSWEGGEDQPVTAVSQTPERAAADRDDVDPEAVRDVVDPLTFLAQVLDRVEETNGDSCDLKAKTWDGRRLAQIETLTHETVKAARVDCRIVYRDIQGLRKDTPWRLQEQETMRVARFEKKEGRWLPRWIRIEAKVVGFDTTFTTEIWPLD